MTGTTGLGRGEGTVFGAGWISGVLAVTFAALAFGGVLCLLWPWLLTTPDARGHYPLGVVRFLIYAFLVAGFVLGALSTILRRSKTLGLAALALATAATVLGGSGAAVGDVDGAAGYLGLDWFLLNVLVLALLFVPIERLFARLPSQPIFRPGWPTDLAHFAASHLLVQVTVLLTLAPATLFFAWAVRPGLQQGMQSQPLIVQFVEVLIVADLAEYVAHRAFPGCRDAGPSTRSTTRPGRWTGWPPAGCTWSTSW